MSLVDRALSYASLALEGWGITDGRPLRGPLYAQIGISDPCDHRCVMCPYHPPGEADPTWMGERRPGLMELRRFTQLVDELTSLGTRRVDLVGRGEPLLHPQFVEMMRYAKHKGLFVSVTTNASRLDGTRAEAMVDAQLDALRVSLDAGMVEAVAACGADAGHFQHVIDGPAAPMRLALDESSLEKLSREEIPAAIERARRLGVETDLESLAARVPPGDAADAVGPCHVGSFFTVVLGNGAIMPCCQTKTALGHLDGGFRSTWLGERYRAFRRAARALPAKSPELATCECDRCYFRPHNQSVERVLHPLRAVHRPDPRGLIGVDQLLRMSLPQGGGAARRR
jgi:hypothetical protein